MGFFDQAPIAFSEDAILARGQLTFENYSADVDRLFDDLERPIFTNPDWPSPYAVAQNLVVEAYLEEGALEPLADILKDHRWPLGPDVEEILEQFGAQGRIDLVERVRTGCYETTKAFLRREHRALRRNRDMADAQRLFGEARERALGANAELARHYSASNEKQKVASLAKEKTELEPLTLDRAL